MVQLVAALTLTWVTKTGVDISGGSSTESVRCGLALRLWVYVAGVVLVGGRGFVVGVRLEGAVGWGATSWESLSAELWCGVLLRVNAARLVLLLLVMIQWQISCIDTYTRGHHWL